jgi:hypothetical protein
MGVYSKIRLGSDRDNILLLLKINSFYTCFNSLEASFQPEKVYSKAIVNLHN